MNSKYKQILTKKTTIFFFVYLGNTEGSAELQDFKSVGVNTFAYNYNLTLVHASQVYVTVVAINGAGLRNVAYSTAIDIDKTPPVLEEVHDGTGM